MRFSAFVVLSALLMNVKKKFKEKLSLVGALKKIVACVKTRKIEMNITN